MEKGDYEIRAHGSEASVASCGSGGQPSAPASVAATPGSEARTPLRQGGAAVVALSPSRIPPWAPAAPALKLLRRGRQGSKDSALYPLLSQIGSGSYGTVYASTRDGTELGHQSLRQSGRLAVRRGGSRASHP